MEAILRARSTGAFGGVVHSRRTTSERKPLKQAPRFQMEGYCNSKSEFPHFFAGPGWLCCYEAARLEFDHATQGDFGKDHQTWAVLSSPRSRTLSVHQAHQKASKQHEALPPHPHKSSQKKKVDPPARPRKTPPHARRVDVLFRSPSHRSRNPTWMSPVSRVVACAAPWSKSARPLVADSATCGCQFFWGGGGGRGNLCFVLVCFSGCERCPFFLGGGGGGGFSLAWRDGGGGFFSFSLFPGGGGVKGKPKRNTDPFLGGGGSTLSGVLQGKQKEDWTGPIHFMAFLSFVRKSILFFALKLETLRSTKPRHPAPGVGPWKSPRPARARRSAAAGPPAWPQNAPPFRNPRE